MPSESSTCTTLELVFGSTSRNQYCPAGSVTPGSATGWLINRDAAQAQSYYRRYLKNGAYVSWGGAFGSSASACPAPDFPAAAQRQKLEQMRWIKRTLRQAAPFVAGGLLLLVAGGVLLWRRRKVPANKGGAAQA